MLLISRLREFVAECKAGIQNINAAHLVMSTDDLSKIMKEHPENKNILMVAIIPEHDIVGKEDNTKVDNGTMFYFLEKTDYSEIDFDQYIDIFIRTQLVAKEFIEKILSDNSQEQFCGLFQALDTINYKVSPVRALSSCNGHVVSLTFKTTL